MNNNSKNFCASNYHPFGMVIEERSKSYKHYRFGFNGQEKVDEVSGSGNSMTAEYWQYDSRVARRWNMDPKPNSSISVYTCFGNNSILNSDHNGDSLRVSFAYKEHREAFDAFFNTGVGRAYLAKFAAKGQTINGHTFKKDGEFHKQSIDLHFTEADLGSNALGKTEQGMPINNDVSEAGLIDGRFKVNVLLNTNNNAVLRNKRVKWDEYRDFKTAKDNGTSGWRLQHLRNRFIVDKAQTLIHETFIHVEFDVKDYLDGGRLYNHSYTNRTEHHAFQDAMRSARTNGGRSVFTKNQGKISPLIVVPNKGYLYNYDGWHAAKAIHKWYGTGYSDSQVYNRYIGKPRGEK